MIKGTNIRCVRRATFGFPGQVGLKAARIACVYVLACVDPQCTRSSLGKSSASVGVDAENIGDHGNSLANGHFFRSDQPKIAGGTRCRRDERGLGLGPYALSPQHCVWQPEEPPAES